MLIFMKNVYFGTDGTHIHYTVCAMPNHWHLAVIRKSCLYLLFYKA